MRGVVLVGGLVLGGIAAAWGIAGNGTWWSSAGALLAVACLIGTASAIPRPAEAAVPFLLAGVVGFVIALDTPAFAAWAVAAVTLAFASRVAARAKRRADRDAAEVDAWLRREVAAMEGEATHRAGRQ